MPDGTAGAPRGRTRWWLVAAVAALPALALLPFLVGFVGIALSDSEYPLGGGPKAVPCAEVLKSGGAVLPEGARPVGACVEQSRQDVSYRATFRMPRAGVAPWLHRTYPEAPAPRTDLCEGEAELCLDLNRARGLPATVHVDAVQIEVEYENAGTALVDFAAFTV
ncbi:hypothetical protein ABZT08_09265 [Streptomyces sp. NPDC005526]|uniref:hypothetical protein n=1 Tax=Streptomyces sp. NPDC005526 TaxID=3156885 RepID=UPI0033BD40AA